MRELLLEDKDKEVNNREYCQFLQTVYFYVVQMAFRLKGNALCCFELNVIIVLFDLMMVP